MTNQRRRDKESSAGCHRKRTKPLVRKSTPGYGDVSTAPARVAKCEVPVKIVLGLWFFPARPVHILPHCSRSAAGGSSGPDRSFMKPRFEPDVPTDASQDLSASLIDPEAYDASEQQFAASLDQTSSRTAPSAVRPRLRCAKFVVEDEAQEVVESQPPSRSKVRGWSGDRTACGTKRSATAAGSRCVAA